MNKVIKQITTTTLLFGLALCAAACGSARSTIGTPAFTPTTSPSYGTLIGDTGASFTNSVPETPWWQMQAPPPPSHMPVHLAWNLSGDVLFDSGSATLSVAASSQLDGIIEAARQHPGATIVVDGYTDDVPDPSFLGGNQGLSAARAASVASKISAAHIPGDHITSIGKGVSQIGTDAQSRRVTISLTVP
jgi:OOP family OmpA-OmpF porin